MSESENNQRLKDIQRAIENFPSFLRKKDRIAKEQKKIQKAFLPVTRAFRKKLEKQKKAQIHPWRPCPLGQHWVHEHPRKRVSSKGKPFNQEVSGHCQKNPSRLDHLYFGDIQETAARHFAKFKNESIGKLPEFKTNGTLFDEFIKGWTLYWNDVLEPTVQLDAKLVKALVASESGFDPAKWNKRRGQNAAHGLMQVTNATVRNLKSSKELKNHFVNLSVSDMTDPNANICAGIRWLFRKKQLLEKKSKKMVDWRDAVREYKGYKAKDKKQKGMVVFDKFWQALKDQK